MTKYKVEVGKIIEPTKINMERFSKFISECNGVIIIGNKRKALNRDGTQDCEMSFYVDGEWHDALLEPVLKKGFLDAVKCRANVVENEEMN